MVYIYTYIHITYHHVISGIDGFIKQLIAGRLRHQLVRASKMTERQSWTKAVLFKRFARWHPIIILGCYPLAACSFIVFGHPTLQQHYFLRNGLMILIDFHIWSGWSWMQLHCWPIDFARLRPSTWYIWKKTWRNPKLWYIHGGFSTSKRRKVTRKATVSHHLPGMNTSISLPLIASRPPAVPRCRMLSGWAFEHLGKLGRGFPHIFTF